MILLFIPHEFAFNVSTVAQTVDAYAFPLPRILLSDTKIRVVTEAEKISIISRGILQIRIEY